MGVKVFTKETSAHSKEVVQSKAYKSRQGGGRNPQIE